MHGQIAAIVVARPAMCCFSYSLRSTSAHSQAQLSVVAVAAHVNKTHCWPLNIFHSQSISANRRSFEYLVGGAGSGGGGDDDVVAVC